jgi:hypothetical protein
MKTHFILNLENPVEFYESFSQKAINYGDGNQVDFYHPIFDIIRVEVEKVLNQSLIVSSARYIFDQSDLESCNWHNDAENSDDQNTKFSLLLYFNSMGHNTGGHLEFANFKLIPYRGLCVLIFNEDRRQQHRATPLTEKIERKLLKITFK